MRRYFVADIHLSEDRPDITQQFIDFLHRLPDACELYILGDLFDYWIGDDSLLGLHHQLSQALQALAQRQIHTYFMAGNRDFLLGKAYAERCHMQMLPQIHTIANQTQTVVLLHGDLLCTDDRAYQRFRKLTHNRLLQWLFLKLPLAWRMKIAGNLRDKSRQANQQKSVEIMDVNQAAVEALLERTHADVMIHGHTHKPGLHPVALSQHLAYRYVVGVWDEQCDYVLMDDNSIALRAFNAAED